jgi:peroxidase
MQSITYNEYLPTLLGVDALPEYGGYDVTVNPGISRIFSTAAFRLGHTQLSTEIVRLDSDGTVIPEGNLTLADSFFPGSGALQIAGIDPILRGLAASASQQVDTETISDLRNLLFGFGPAASACDLFAINIQRGRANGLADYNTIRASFGLERVQHFAEITRNLEKQAALEALYGSVDNIDAVGGGSETRI